MKLMPELWAVTTPEASKPMTKPLNFKPYKCIWHIWRLTGYKEEYQLYDTLCTMTLPPLAGKQSCPTTVPCHLPMATKMGIL